MATVRDALEVSAEMYKKDVNNVSDYVQRHLRSLSIWEELRYASEIHLCQDKGLSCQNNSFLCILLINKEKGSYDCKSVYFTDDEAIQARLFIQKDERH